MSSRTMSDGKSAWAVGIAATAAMFLMLAGLFQFLQGLAALIKGDFFVVGANYTYRLDTTAWGWIHLILGIVGVAVGFGLLAGATWARVLGILIAILGMVANFLWLPYQPVWAIIVIIFYGAVIWALTTWDRAVG